MLFFKASQLLCHIFGDSKLNILISWISLFIILYSLIINAIFGHGTVWKSSIYESKRWFLFYCSYFRGERRTRREKKKILISKQSSISLLQAKAERCLGIINDDISLIIFSYLTVFDLINISITSNKLNNLVNNSLIWDNLRTKLLKSVLKMHPTNLSLLVNGSYKCKYNDKQLNPKEIFFQLLLNFPMNLIKYIMMEKEPRFCLIIKRSVYDLTDFLEYHPGGKEIIMEWNNKDATRVFSLANHSSLALKNSEKYMIWSPIRLIGSKKLPKFAYKLFNK